jgi:uncharacterized membrane protein (DUF373 family)
MADLVRKLERAIMLCLVVMMSVVLVLATLELGWIIIKDVITPPVLILEIDELLDIFGIFMLALIGIELLETIIKTYAKEQIDRVEIVLAVAIIAISRKVIILDVKELGSLTLLGIAAIIIALSVGFFLLKRSHNSQGDSERNPK